jgi:subtilisin family serine protease
MSEQAKISRVFEPLLAEHGPNDRTEAIVFYRAPAVRGRPARGRLGELKARLDRVKRRAVTQRQTHQKISAHYLEAAGKRVKKGPELEMAAIGASALPVARVEVTRRTLGALAKNPDVVAIMPNQRVRLLEPHRIEFGDLRRRELTNKLTWGLEALEVAELWDTTKGRGVNVAVLDTGVFGDHAALAGRVREFTVIDPLGRRISALPTFDGGSHGTHVCGTIAGGRTAEGVAIGMAPEAKLIVGAVLVGEATLITLLEGLSWALEKGADVVNLSLGFTYYEPLFAQVFAQLIDFGMLPVVAIGNENHGNTSSPGSAHNALAVGAAELMPRRKLEIANFSSGASFVFPGAEPNALVTKPDVAGPGVDVYSCIPPEGRTDGSHDYTYMAGTSMATPHVAGAVALLMAAEPDTPVADIAQALKDTARHPGGADARPDNRWGYGMIRPLEALGALRS